MSWPLSWQEDASMQPGAYLGFSRHVADFGQDVIGLLL
jgi:hypothetical protein